MIYRGQIGTCLKQKKFLGASIEKNKFDRKNFKKKKY